jgi:hypothetical protein
MEATRTATILFIIAPFVILIGLLLDQVTGVSLPLCYQNHPNCILRPPIHPYYFESILLVIMGFAILLVATASFIRKRITLDPVIWKRKKPKPLSANEELAFGIYKTLVTVFELG